MNIIQVFKPKFNEQQKGLPLYCGELSCGLFGISDDFVESYLSLDELFMRNRESTFFVRASGDSMLPEIKNGDILIVDRSYKVLDQSIVAVFHNGNPLCKKFLQRENHILLRSLNKKYSDIQVCDDDELQVFGVVIGVARDFRK
ncbi:hypothetical protein BIY24_08410 [Halobacteriovorax marinus]|uniref:LexA family protein n=1 Tax=Halobacteriovorax marinus TaxID=97084 RepID=UPI000BC2D7D0|nr:S24 family peptidase [Halobacteriovorax marinus]ATH07972.1 hypothetical protein BIY24_08410 [Halobacteriovorax marinus]